MMGRRILCELPILSFVSSLFLGLGATGETWIRIRVYVFGSLYDV